jgi:nucleotide sugar dehydrogenase
MKKSIIDTSVPHEFPDRNICILGLGFVGVTLATAMAEVGFQVTGIEIREDVLEKLKSGNAHFFEPGLSVQLKKVIETGHLQVFNKIPEECKATVFIITVGTPLDVDYKINLSSIRNISQDILAKLKDGDLVILRSTVKLGTTRSVVKEILKESKKSFEIAFCPERTVEGQAMSELRHLPQVVGAENLSTSIRTGHIFQFLTPTVLRVSDIETAEMIKLIDNTKRDVIFGFSNEVARLCDAAGLSAEEVISVGRFGYSRTDLPTPGPVGGPCLSKDSHILAQSVSEFGVVPEITLAARRVNEKQPFEAAQFLEKIVKKSGQFPEDLKISLLGIAFKGKPATDDVRGTTAKPILEELKRAFPKAHFFGFDPVVEESAIKEFGLEPKTDIKEAIVQSHISLILNNHPFFATLPLEKWAKEMLKPSLIYDFWNNFSRNLYLPKGIRYIALGSHKFAKEQL